MDTAIKVIAALSLSLALTACEETITVSISSPHEEAPGATAPNFINGYYVSVATTEDPYGMLTSYEPIRLDMENRQFVSGIPSSGDIAVPLDRFSPAQDYMQYRKFNENGDMVSWEIVNRGVQTQYQDYLYNEDGLLVSSTSTRDDSIWYETFLYNDVGQLVQKDYVISPGNTTIQLTFDYDADGKRLSMKTYLSGTEGEPSTTYFYYNEMDQMNESQTDFQSDNTIDYRRVYQYDQAGNRTEIASYNELSELLSISRYRYEPTDEPVFNLGLFDQMYNPF